MILRDTKPESIQEAEPLYRLLVSGRVPICLLGSNETGREVANVLVRLGREPEAFINDYEALTEFCGRPVIKTVDIPSNALVVSCSTAVNPVSALRRLKAAGLERVLDYFTLYLCGNGLFPPPKFCGENIVDIESNRSRYDWVESLLADETSKLTFQRLVEFRYNFDLSAMEEFRTQLEKQYFEPFVPMNGHEIFVDGGGFDGRTTEAFIEKCPRYRRVHYFEPDPLLMSSSRKRLVRFEKIQYHEVALAEQEGEVYFNQTGTGSGAISEGGKLRVRTSRLDGLLPQPPTFVKLDIEGAELSALGGAANIISVNHPTLAVCVYHRQSDVWRVPEKVLSLHSEYKVLLRHYTEGIEETVMYFV